MFILLNSSQTPHMKEMRDLLLVQFAMIEKLEFGKLMWVVMDSIEHMNV